MSRIAEAIAAAKTGINTITGGKLDQAEPGLLGTVSSGVVPSPHPPKHEAFEVGNVGTWSIPAPDGGGPRPFTGQWPPDPKDIETQAAANIAKASHLEVIKKAGPSLFTTNPTKSESEIY